MDVVSVMDVTWGKGGWWKDHWKPDIRHDVELDGVDYRKLPEENGSIDVIAFDPPYVAKGGRETSGIKEFDTAYGMKDAPRTPREMEEMNAAGLRECARVLAPRGILLVKCCNYVSSGRKVWGERFMWNVGLAEGLELLDKVEHLTGSGPQPAVNLDGTTRVPAHSRLVHSTMLVWTKRKRS